MEIKIRDDQSGSMDKFTINPENKKEYQRLVYTLKDKYGWWPFKEKKTWIDLETDF